MKESVIKLKSAASNFYLFRRYPISKQFTKFCIVGSTNFVVDFIVYIILTRLLGVYYLAAAVISFIIAVSWSYFMNKKWTFRNKSPKISSQYLKFFSANAFGLVLNLLLMLALVELMGVYDVAAKVLVAVAIAFINFGLSRYWTFREV